MTALVFEESLRFCVRCDHAHQMKQNVNNVPQISAEDREMFQRTNADLLKV